MRDEKQHRERRREEMREGRGLRKGKKRRMRRRERRGEGSEERREWRGAEEREEKKREEREKGLPNRPTQPPIFKTNQKRRGVLPLREFNKATRTVGGWGRGMGGGGPSLRPKPTEQNAGCPVASGEG